MSRFECARTVHQIGASRGSLRGQSARAALAIIGAASLAACAQSPVARQKAEFATASRQAVAERHHETRKLAGVYARPRHHSPTRTVERRTGSQGVASFYSDDQATASGEKFDKRELTAAHPTLPFGTRLRVTNVSTGRSVTVRVNDRGPYVHGRVVDVSYSAAEALGMVNKGVANVKLDVVQ